jgi:serine/threonine protein kinase
MKYAAKGSLSEFLSKYPKTASQWPTMIGILICDIVLGMRYVHSQRILHRDLKPSNILLNKNFRGKICDFGVSRPYDYEGPAAGDTGTYEYCAPEQLGEDLSPGPGTDVFAFGLVLYEILTGTPVIARGLPLTEIRDLHRRRCRPAIPAQIRPLMARLISQCWSTNPDCRPSFRDIWNEIESAGFYMLPEANGSDIRAAVSKVICWEDNHERTTYL